MEYLLEPEEVQSLMEYLESGAPRATAMAAVGVSKANYSKFAKLAKSGVSPHAELLQSMVQAEAIGECQRLVTVAKSKDWRANMTSLERQFPDKYGQKVQVEVKQELERVFSVVEANVSPQQYEAILAQIASAGHGEDVAGEAQEPRPAIH